MIDIEDESVNQENEFWDEYSEEKRAFVSLKEIWDIGFKFFKKCKEENVIISPLSLTYCLAMLLNGARDNSLKQLENLFGVDVTRLNELLKKYLDSIDKKHLKLANSIWLRDGFKVNKEYKKINKDNFNSSIFTAPFDDKTLKTINNWVSENTDGLINNLLQEPSMQSMIILINTVLFKCDWVNDYKKEDTFKGNFFNKDGSFKVVKYLNGVEEMYYEDDTCVGFEKLYKNYFKFKAFLPKSKDNFDEFVNSFTLEKYINLIDNRTDKYYVEAVIPKFSVGYKMDFGNLLKEFGVKDVFDGKKSNLSGVASLCDNNLYIGNVIQETKIDLNEKGTKVASATAIDFLCLGVPPQKEYKEVYLIRPFVYMITDYCDNPLFIGKYEKVN